MRFIGEAIAKQIFKEKKLNVPPDPSQHNRQPDCHAQLVAISRARITPKDTMDDFFKVKEIGNKIHDHSVTIEEGQDALEAAYRIAVWYVRDYKLSSQPIPEFVLPEPRKPEPPKVEIDKGQRAKSLLDTPTKRIIAGILSAFGLIWLLEIYLDPEHRWHVALEKAIRIAFVLAVIVLMALPFALVADKVTLWQLYVFFVKWLEQKLPWNQYLVQSLVLVLLLPFLYAVQLSLFTRSRAKRRLGTILLISMAVGFNLMFYFATKPIVFDKYYGIENNRIVIYDRSGLDPQTGKPLQKVTPVITKIYELQEQGMRIASVDPHTSDWFSSLDGEPVLWYSRFPNGELAFYNMPGNDPRTGDPLTPVTRELYFSWSGANPPRPPKPNPTGSSPGSAGEAVAV